MRQTVKMLLMILTVFCGLVVFCIAAELLLDWASHLTGIDRLATLQAKDLLGALGVFGTLAFTIASRKKEEEKRTADEEAELKRAEPQIELTISNSSIECVVTASNMGPKVVKCLSYEGQALTDSLLPGGSFQFVLTKCDPESYAPSYRAELPKLVWSSSPLVDGYPERILLCAYDCKERFWALEFKYKNGELIDFDQWLAA